MACALLACAVGASAQGVDVSSTTRLASVVAAISAKDPAVVPMLAARLDAEPEPDIRSWIVRGLALLDAARSLPTFEKALKDADPQVRADAAIALGQLGGARAAGDLAGALPVERNPGVRQTIAFWLGSFKDAASVAALGGVLTADPNPSVRVQAAQSLKRAGTPEARARLAQGRDDEDERVRRAADGR